MLFYWVSLETQANWFCTQVTSIEEWLVNISMLKPSILVWENESNPPSQRSTPCLPSLQRWKPRFTGLLLLKALIFGTQGNSPCVQSRAFRSLKTWVKASDPFLPAWSVIWHGRSSGGPPYTCASQLLYIPYGHLPADNRYHRFAISINRIGCQVPACV